MTKITKKLIIKKYPKFLKIFMIFQFFLIFTERWTITHKIEADSKKQLFYMQH